MKGRAGSNASGSYCQVHFIHEEVHSADVAADVVCMT
jgi:hypothetical protein